MIGFIKKNWLLLLGLVISLVIFLPSFGTFYTNDDFFLLKIGKAETPAEFLNFFSLIKGPDGLGMYRPLTTQVFYFLSWKAFSLNPLGLHIVAFLTFSCVVFLVYKLIYEMFRDSLVAGFASFLYATSATHFGHLYYLATFQELGLTLFVLLSCLAYFKKKIFLSFVFFVLAILSKETAVITPILLLLISFIRGKVGSDRSKFRKMFVDILPFVACIFIYILIRLMGYGFAKGDSYIWNFSPLTLANTYFWYVLWSLNLPETLVDFVGPGIKVNPNLFLYWGKEFRIIFSLFFAEGILVALALIKALKEKNWKNILERNRVGAFAVLWFVISLLPVAFLPIHKFSYYLTLPMVGVALRISYLLIREKPFKFAWIIFGIIWVGISAVTSVHTANISWITQGAKISKGVYDYIAQNKSQICPKSIVFVDTPKDLSLPWSPTANVKTALSDRNFFWVFHPELHERIFYGKEADPAGQIFTITSRHFLGY